MRICCLSDLHGHLPLNIPDCDLLLLGGDYCPMRNEFMQSAWIRTKFSKWISRLSERGITIVGVAGNHDFVFEEIDPDMVPEMEWTYLQDSGAEVLGLKVWGSPWQPRFHDWAYNLDEPQLKEKWDLIPEGTDIILLHGPPFGYGDFSPFGKTHTGSPSLTERIEELKPKLVVAGHIHSGHGVYSIGDTIFVNASYVNEDYKPHYPIEVVEL